MFLKFIVFLATLSSTHLHGWIFQDCPYQNHYNSIAIYPGQTTNALITATHIGDGYFLYPYHAGTALNRIRLDSGQLIDLEYVGCLTKVDTCVAKLVDRRYLTLFPQMVKISQNFPSTGQNIKSVGYPNADQRTSSTGYVENNQVEYVQLSNLDHTMFPEIEVSMSAQAGSSNSPVFDVNDETTMVAYLNAGVEFNHSPFGNRQQVQFLRQRDNRIRFNLAVPASYIAAEIKNSNLFTADQICEDSQSKSIYICSQESTNTRVSILTRVLSYFK